MLFYDYEQIPLEVADAAFAAFIGNPERESILDLLAELIRHCDAWCEANGAFSEQDGRVAVINRLQAYLHQRYSAELSELMGASILRYRQQQDALWRLYERRN